MDTNVVLDRTLKNIIDGFNEPTEVILPLVMLEELDTFKKGYEIKNVNARSANNFLDELRGHGELHKGVKYGKHIVKVTVDIADLDLGKVDYKIINTAKEHDAVLITQDINERVIADAVGVESTHYRHDDVDAETLYTGVCVCDISDEDIEDFINKKYIRTNTVMREGSEYELHHNEFVIMKDSQGGESEGIFDAESGTIQPLQRNYEAFGINPKRDTKGTLIQEQKFLMHLLLDKDTDFVSAIGPSGIGKTFITLAVALQKMLKEQEYSRIVVMRPLIPIGQEIGHLPGDKREKLSPWMASTTDNLEALLAEETFNRDNDCVSAREVVEAMMDSGQLEFEGISFIRGRSIPQQFIIVDDAQNLTVQEATTIITRAGEGSKVVFLGDLSEKQIDNHRLTPSSNGLAYAVDRLHGSVGIGHISTLDESKVVRSRLARLGVEKL